MGCAVLLYFLRSFYPFPSGNGGQLCVAGGHKFPRPSSVFCGPLFLFFSFFSFLFYVTGNHAPGSSSSYFNLGFELFSHTQLGRRRGCEKWTATATQLQHERKTHQKWSWFRCAQSRAGGRRRRKGIHTHTQPDTNRMSMRFVCTSIFFFFFFQLSHI